MRITIDIEANGTLLRHELFAESEGAMHRQRDLGEGCVLRQGDSGVERRYGLAEPEVVRIFLEAAGVVSDVGGAAAALYGAAKISKAVWVKVNGRRVPVDEAAIKHALEEARDDDGKTLRLVED